MNHLIETQLIVPQSPSSFGFWPFGSPGPLIDGVYVLVVVMSVVSDVLDREQGNHQIARTRA